MRLLKQDGLVFALWVFGLLAVAIVYNSGIFSPLANRDFIAVWVAGKLAASGHASQAFDAGILQAVAREMAGTTFKIAYPYPPHALFIAVPLSLLPFPAAFWLWQAVSALLFYVASRPYLPDGMPRILAVLTPAALINVLFGQVGLFFGALWLFAFSGSSVAVAALTFKPHLGLLAGVEAVRRRRLILTTVLALAVIGASGLLFGAESWQVWFTNAINRQVGDLAGPGYGNWAYQMTTPYLGYGWVGWAAFAFAAVVLLIRCFNVFTAATAAFLIAPYGYHYDMTVVCLGFGILLFQKWRQLPAWQTFVCALVFLSPALVRIGTWIVPPLLLAGLYIQTRKPNWLNASHA